MSQIVRAIATSVFAMACLLAATAFAQPYGAAGQQVAVKKSQTTAPYGYWEYLPSDYNHTSAQKSGLMIFLHGAGEKGNGETTLDSLVNGGGWPTNLIAKNGKTYPVIVLSPQCSDPIGGGPAHQACGWWDATRLEQFTRYAMARYNVDTTRIYVSGLSMGGAGTVILARKMPNEIAAIVPICQAEGGNATLDVNLRTMPMWITHANDDTVVGIGNSKHFLNTVTEEVADIFSGFDFGPSGTPLTDQVALYRLSTKTHEWLKQTSVNNLDADIRQRYTVYKDGGHGIWGRTYADNNIMNWLFAQKLGSALTDVTPDAFSFTAQTGVAFGAVVKSNAITVAGINAPSPISVSNGEYSVGCTTTFTTAAGTINNGQAVCVRHTAPVAPSANKSSTLTIGGVAGTFTSTTAACPVEDCDGDGIPDSVEAAEGRNPYVKDNDVFANNRLFVMQQYRDLMRREATTAEINAGVAALTSGQSKATLVLAMMEAPAFADLAGPVVRLYDAYFERAAERGGYDFWVTEYQKQNPWTFIGISNYFVISAEFKQRYGSLTSEQFVTLIYRNILNRDPEPTGFAFWTGELNSGRRSAGQVMADFSESPENKLKTKGLVQVVSLYVNLLKRDVDPTVLTTWAPQINSGTPATALIADILSKPEYRARFLP